MITDVAGPPPKLADWERPLFEQIRTQMPTDPPVPVGVDHELDDGDVVDLGGVQAVAVAVPGHTPGSVAFHLPEPRALFTGDTIARSPDGRVVLGVFNVDPARQRQRQRQRQRNDCRSPLRRSSLRQPQ